jgi:glycogen synthase
VDATEDPVRANGIKFVEYTSTALSKAIRKAMVIHGNGHLLRHYQRNAMGSDFSWDRTVAAYLRAYEVKGRKES